MLNITMCGSDKLYISRTITVINMVLVNYDIDYRIHKFSGLNERKRICDDEFRIYIIDNDLELISRIRKNDFDSIIILVTDNKRDNIIYNKLMIFDIISKNSNYEEKLTKVLISAIEIYDKYKVFTFAYNHIIYRIPYKEINYIEKEPLIKRCIIHTVNNNYYYVNSIENLLGILGVNFVKTHQSCISQ